MASKKNKLKVSRKQRFDQQIPQRQLGPQMPVQQGEGFNDLGREDARLIREANQTFPDNAFDRTGIGADKQLMEAMMAEMDSKTIKNWQSLTPQQQQTKALEALQEVAEDVQEVLSEPKGKKFKGSMASRLNEAEARIIADKLDELFGREIDNTNRDNLAEKEVKIRRQTSPVYDYETLPDGTVNRAPSLDKDGKPEFLTTRKGKGTFKSPSAQSSPQPNSMPRWFNTIMGTSPANAPDWLKRLGADFLRAVIPGADTDASTYDPREMPTPGSPQMATWKRYLKDMDIGVISGDMSFLEYQQNLEPEIQRANKLYNQEIDLGLQKDSWESLGYGKRKQLGEYYARTKPQQNALTQLDDFISSNGTIRLNADAFKQRAASMARPVAKNIAVAGADVALDMAINQIPQPQIREPVRAAKDAAALLAAPIVSLLGLSGDTPNKEVQLNATDTLVDVGDGEVIIRSKSPTYNQDYPLDPRHWKFVVGSGDVVETRLSVEEANELLQSKEQTVGIREGSIVPAGYQYDEQNRAEVAANDAAMARQRQLDNSPVTAADNPPPAPILPPVEQARPQVVNRGGSIHLDFNTNRRPSVSPVQTPEVVKPLAPEPIEDPNSEYKQMLAGLNDNSTKAERDKVRDFGLKQHKQHHPQLY